MHGAFLLYLEEKLKKKTNNIHVYTYLIQRNTTYDIQIELSPFYYNVQNWNFRNKDIDIQTNTKIILSQNSLLCYEVF